LHNDGNRALCEYQCTRFITYTYRSFVPMLSVRLGRIATQCCVCFADSANNGVGMCSINLMIG